LESTAVTRHNDISDAEELHNDHNKFTAATHHNYISDIEELHDDHNESTSTTTSHHNYVSDIEELQVDPKESTLYPDHKNDIEQDDPGLEPNNIITSKFLFIHVLYLLKY
jgi:hypothetical protein